MKNYVLGIVLVGKDKTLLQLKNRGGDLLLNKFNGIGGKIEKDESSLHAIRREYKEETGDQNNLKWVLVGSLNGLNYKIDVYKVNVVDYYYDGFLFNSTDSNFEKLILMKIKDINWDLTAPNLKQIYKDIGALNG